MSKIKEIMHELQSRIQDWDAEKGIVFIRTNDNVLRQRLQRHFNMANIPTVNIFTLPERIKGLVNEFKLVVVISAVCDADRFIERSDMLIDDSVSQRIFHLVKSNNPNKMMEPVAGEVMISY